ncbi:MAG: DNA methylase, partial [Thermodesulfobacteriota bacterium]|nr:DNA methylase [Thermodesulfobacteriota bacterium]
EGKSGERMVAVVLHKPGQMGKRYRIATEKDDKVFREAAACLEKTREKLMAEWGMDPVPDEPLTRVPVSFGVINVWVYGMNTWGSLFNPRQKLALITLSDKVRQTYGQMIASKYEADYAKAVVTYLAFAVDRQVDYNSSLCVWAVAGEFIAHTFGRQALPMVWDFIELSPWSNATGDWHSAMEWITRVLEFCSGDSFPATITQASATSLSFPENYFDAVFTDPPYYDNVPYSHISDFFYVWLKRTLGEVHPELFSTPLTPKKNEIVAYSAGKGGFEEGKRFFEEMLKKSFQEIHRVLKQDGIAVIVYAHKSTEGWETLINSLLDSGLVMTGAWPLHTEMQARLRAQESATLASSIYIIARKMERQATGFYQEVRQALEDHLKKKLERLWQEGIGGADFFVAAIGSAIEVFGKYEKVMDYEGAVVRADRMLEDVRKIATEYAVRQILHNGFVGEISDLTRFYVLYRWNYGSAKIHFDEAQKLARSCGIDIAREWGGGFIRKEKEFIRVLGPEDRDPDDMKRREELIDVLHRCLRLWEKGKRNDFVALLQESGLGKSEAFYRVGQAISETLPNESKEKKLLDGFLAGRERLREEMTKTEKQERML